MTWHRNLSYTGQFYGIRFREIEGVLVGIWTRLFRDSLAGALSRNHRSCNQYDLKISIRPFLVSGVRTSFVISQFLKESKLWNLNFAFHFSFGPYLFQNCPNKHEGLLPLILHPSIGSRMDEWIHCGYSLMIGRCLPNNYELSGS